MDLVPAKATFAPGEPIEVEVRGVAGSTSVRLLHLDRVVAQTEGETSAVFPPQPPGGYGVEAQSATTAVDVLADPLERTRYGFLTDFAPGRATEDATDTVRRLHLNAVQFYDWMYRHAALLPPEDVFTDALGRELSLETIRRFVAAVRDAGSVPMGYAAVYAVGRDEWPAWHDAGLFHPTGEPWKLGDDFLTIVDPTNERWVDHLAHDLARAREEVGFGGFQLDQYGWPKAALRADGTSVDLVEAFPALIDRLAHDQPDTRFIFNNVNDFPTWATADADQAAVYIEVWAPHTSLDDLARLIERAHSLSPSKSIIVATYLPSSSQAGQDILLATVFSHGATAILHGEARGILTDPYFVRHGELNAAGFETARLYYDFAVRYGDLLFDRAAVDISRTYVGGINTEILIEARAEVSSAPRPGTVWARALLLETGTLVSLIDLTKQTDVSWEGRKNSSPLLADVRLRLRRSGTGKPRFLFADPTGRPALTELPVEDELPYDAVSLPAFSTWAIVWVPRELP